MRERLLLVHENAGAYKMKVANRFPSIDVKAATSNAELIPILEDWRPTIAYSCVTPGFPRHQHTCLLNGTELRWIQVGGSGFDHFSGRHVHDIALSNAAGVLAPYLAETIMTMIGVFSYRLLERLRNQSGRAWRPLPWQTKEGQVLLIVGTGAIAREVARRANFAGMHVTGISRTPRRIEGFHEIFGREQLDQTIGSADFVSLHVPLDAETCHLINAHRLSLMQRHAWLLNAARGPVVDQIALVDALRNNTIAGAFLDVVENEPLAPESPLWELDNVVISAHTADMVVDYERRLADFFMVNLANWLEGRQLNNRVQ